jgi:hypothetical protein
MNHVCSPAGSGNDRVVVPPVTEKEGILDRIMAHLPEGQVQDRLAHFPFQKTLEQFDFSFQPTLDPRQFDELASLGFVAEGRNVILLRPPGVGKTHLAVALGLKACLAAIRPTASAGTNWPGGWWLPWPTTPSARSSSN